jgi:hypothetical protein
VVKATGQIITVAGTGAFSYNGDGIAAASAELYYPTGVAVDAAGDVFIADQGNSRVREVVKATGQIATVAGTGTPGYNSDIQPATAGQLYYPTGVAVDAAGDLIIADAFNHRVRQVTPSVTVVVTPPPTVTMIAITASSATAVQGHPVTLTAAVSAVPLGPGTPAGGSVTFNDGATVLGTAPVVNGTAVFPTTSLGLGAHTLTASYSGDGAWFPASSTGTIATVAGTGVPAYNGDNIVATAAQLSSPYGAAVDAAGNVFIADFYSNRVREVVKATGLIVTVAGTGVAGYNGDNIAATAAQLSYPTAVAVDAAGDVFIAEANSRVREVVKATGLIVTVAGTGTGGYNGDNIAATAAQLNVPTGVALDAAGDVFIADSQNHRVREVVKATGLIITFAGTGTYGYNGDSIAAASAQLYAPNGVALDAAGDVFIADQGNSRVREVVKATGQIITVAGTGGGGYNGDNIAATAAQLNYPTGVAVDAAGDVFIADSQNNRVRAVVKATSLIATVAGTGTYGYNGDNIAATAARLAYPNGVAVDAAGDLFIVDTSNYRVRQVTPAVVVNVVSNNSASFVGADTTTSGALKGW